MSARHLARDGVIADQQTARFDVLSAAYAQGSAHERTRQQRKRSETSKSRAAKGPALNAALRQLEVRGSLVRFPDGQRVALSKTPDGIVHLGSVACRGPNGVRVADWEAMGLTLAQARAAEFVSHWFGAPLDAVASGEHGMLWGLWPLHSDCLTRALWSFKQADSNAFNTLLCAYGIDVNRNDELAPVRLSVDGDKLITQGSSALSALAHPRRLAVLVRASRHPGLIRAQLSTTVRQVVRPTLDTRLVNGVSIGRQFTTPTLLAALMHAASVLDPARFAELVEGLGDPSGSSSNDGASGAANTTDIAESDDHILLLVVRYLRLFGEREAANDVLRAGTSHELTGPWEPTGSNEAAEPRVSEAAENA